MSGIPPVYPDGYGNSSYYSNDRPADDTQQPDFNQYVSPPYTSSAPSLPPISAFDNYRPSASSAQQYPIGSYQNTSNNSAQSYQVGNSSAPPYYWRNPLSAPDEDNLPYRPIKSMLSSHQGAGATSISGPSTSNSVLPRESYGTINYKLTKDEKHNETLTTSRAILGYVVVKTNTGNHNSPQSKMNIFETQEKARQHRVSLGRPQEHYIYQVFIPEGTRISLHTSHERNKLGDRAYFKSSVTTDSKFIA
jgi:hypothetical protein